MNSYKKNKILQFLFPFLLAVGVFLLYLGFNNKETVALNYIENNSIDYNVYLKDNVFFDEPFLPEGRTYIASLINYIDVTFHYNVSYDHTLSGKYNYKYVALVRANKRDGSGYYWEKEFDLTDEKTVNINNATIAISDNVKVNYGTYNEILNKFRKEYAVDTNAELKIIMRINGYSTAEGIPVPIEVDSEMNLTVPLLEQSLEVSINKDVPNTNNAITFEQPVIGPMYLLYKVFGFILIFVSIFGFIYVTIENISYRKRNAYELTLQNILSNYDSIIANVENMPDIKKFNKIDVSTFEELIDVYNEVRMPINYCQKKNESIFIIINDSIVWIYTLKKGNSTKRVDNSEKKKDKRKTK